MPRPTLKRIGNAPSKAKKKVVKKKTVPTLKREAVPAKGKVDCGPCVKAGAEPKSGCAWCPLFPFAKDWEQKKGNYLRDGEKILAKAKDPHVIHTRNVCERPWKKVDVLFVGEAPGAEEDKKGAPFVGRSGRLLRTAIADLTGLEEDQYAVTNLVRCRPPLNRDPRKTEVQSCSPELIREIKARDPKLIVVLGNNSMNFLAGQTGITTFQGHFLQATHPEVKAPVLACLHPAYVLRMDHFMDAFIDAIAQVKDFLEGKVKQKPGIGEYETVADLDGVKALFKKFRKAKKVVAFDTETGSLTPFQDEFPRLLCFSFSNEEGKGYTIPFDHEDSPWCEGGEKEHEREKVAAQLRHFFKGNLPKIAQNEKFDRQHIRKALGVEPERVIGDTMLTHLVLDERRGTHGLKVLAFLYTGMGGYERPLEKYISSHKAANPKLGGSYAAIPGHLLFPYAAMDTDVTLRVFNGMMQELDYRKNPRFRHLAEDFLPDLSVALADAEYQGAEVDKDVIKQLDVKYRKLMLEASSAIENLPTIKKFVADQIKSGKKGPEFIFNPGSTAQLRTVLFDYYKLNPVELTDTGFLRLAARYAKINKKRAAEKKSPTDFRAVVKAAIEKREWDHFTTKADVLHEYERRKNELAPLILKYREYQTFHSTFIEPLMTMLRTDGRIHGTFLIHGTVTGRLSSSSPNLQNIPSGARQVYVSRFGDEGVIMQADYSQIELRIAASWFNDPSMIKAYKDGIDLHAQTAADIAHMSLKKFMALTEKKRKEMRTRAKRVNFGIMYGIGPPGLVGTLKKDGIFVTVDETKKMIEQYFAVRPALKEGMRAVEEFTVKHGYLESFTGRRRRVPEVNSEDHEIRARALRQSINFPIQNGASEMTLMALALISRVLRQEGFKSRIILTVHDSIIFDCHVDEVMEVSKLVKDIMENLPKYSDEIMPGIDWSWLKVPIVADLEVGHSWGHLVGFNPYEIDDSDGVDDGMWVETDEGGVKPARNPKNVDELWAQMAWKAAS
jgi:uracil-DNA glycosylase family 4